MTTPPSAGSVGSCVPSPSGNPNGALRVSLLPGAHRSPRRPGPDATVGSSANLDLLQLSPRLRGVPDLGELPDRVCFPSLNLLQDWLAEEELDAAEGRRRLGGVLLEPSPGLVQERRVGDGRLHQPESQGLLRGVEGPAVGRL